LFSLSTKSKYTQNQEECNSRRVAIVKPPFSNDFSILRKSQENAIQPSYSPLDQRRQDLKLQFLHNFPKASSVADPQASKNQRKLLSNSVAKTDNAIIPNAHINGVESLTVNKDGKVTVTLDDGGYNY